MIAGLFLRELYSTGLLQIGEFGQFQEAGRLNPSLKSTFTDEIFDIKLSKNKILSADEFLHCTGSPYRKIQVLPTYSGTQSGSQGSPHRSLNRRHTDFQAVGHYISACLIYGYMRFLGLKTKSGLTVD